MSDRPSRTAQLAALARASSAREPAPLRGGDILAERFLDPALRALVVWNPLRQLALRAYARAFPGGYGLLTARTGRFDEVVRTELEAGAAQLVVLGAGYDSRAYREPSAAKARVFEVDAPATSAAKRAKVERLLGGLPPHVTYVAADLGREPLARVLADAGFDTSARTVFTWEGVTYYLDEASVAAVLDVVRACARGSAVVFDYVFRSVVDGTSTAYGARESRAFVAKRGEPFTFGLEPEEVEGFVRARGLEVEANEVPRDLEKRWLADPRTGHLLLRMAACYGIVLARVP